MSEEQTEEEKKKEEKSKKEIDTYFTKGKEFFRPIEKVKTIEEFVRLVRVLTDYWNTDIVWFRGHSKETYKLVPSIYRPEVWKYDLDSETEIEDEFIRLARSFNGKNSRELCRWEWYQIMQHHGVPTRLLDWTSASNVALYFALQDLSNIDNPTIWVIDPRWLNDQTADYSTIFYTDPSIKNKDDSSIVDNYVPTRRGLPEKPLAILPAHIVPRIAAQHGCFTIHGRNNSDLSSQLGSGKNSRIAKIVIENDSANSIRTDLAINGIIETSLFPDLDGLARHLRWNNGMQ